MCRITALGVPVAAEPLNALTPQYVDGLVTYNGVGARNVTDQTARERVSGFSSVVGFKNSPEGSIDAAIQAVVAARAPHEFLGVDRHGVTAQLSTTGNETAHVILRGDKDGPNYSAAHIADTGQRLARPRPARRSSSSTPRTATARRTTCVRSTSCATWPARSRPASARSAA